MRFYKLDLVDIWSQGFKMGNGGGLEVDEMCVCEFSLSRETWLLYLRVEYLFPGTFNESEEWEGGGRPLFPMKVS